MLLVYSIYSASMFTEEMDCFQIRYTLLKWKSLKSTVIKILFFKKRKWKDISHWVCGANKREHTGDINEF